MGVRIKCGEPTAQHEISTLIPEASLRSLGFKYAPTHKQFKEQDTKFIGNSFSFGFETAGLYTVTILIDLGTFLDPSIQPLLFQEPYVFDCE